MDDPGARTAPAGGHPDGATPARFRALAGATVDDLLELRPEWATELGDHRFDDRIADLSSTGLAKAAALARQRRAELAELDRDALDPDERVDHEMLCTELERLAFDVDELAIFSWDPLAYNPGDGLYFLLVRDVLPVADRLRALAARLELLPGRLEDAGRHLEAPPRVHLETALVRHAGTVSMAGEQVSRLLAADPSLRRVVEPAQQHALAALERHRAFLEAALDGPHRDFRLGPRLFARRLALTLASPLAPAEVAARAEARLAVVRAEIAELARLTLGRDAAGLDDEAVTRAALGRVAADAPDDDTVVAAAQEALFRCTDVVRASGLATVPDEPCRIEVMPPFRRGVAVAYCDPAGPLEPGGETHFAIAPTPPEWSPSRRASFYREYNRAMVLDLTVHEAMPGHMLQLAHARRYRGSTPVRRVLYSGTFVEGWAVHAERLMAATGLGGQALRLQQLKMQMRVAINAILDVSVHSGEMEEAEALELMQRRGMQEEGEAVGKWRRACLSSAQLSEYFVGYSELDDLFAGRSFAGGYDEVLAHASPPPSLLATLLDPPPPSPGG